MKLWQKNTDANQAVDRFTVGHDREMDLFLGRSRRARFARTYAHAQLDRIARRRRPAGRAARIKAYHADIVAGRFTIDEGIEDVHSQVEFLLTERIGDAGKKIHSGRSRNDQVLVDLRTFLRRQIKEIVEDVESLFRLLQNLSDKYNEVLMPGYTHLQIAMPSSFGLWLGAYAESLVDDTEMLHAAYRICNKNPLGSAAGYGSSFPLNRTMTTELLGFDTLSYNVVYAQMGRGKTERIMAQAMSSVAATLARLAMDNTMFLNQNFNFISYPAELTTGSSIMPHKKNPDVWELIRGKCNLIQGLPNQIAMMTTNLPIGYNRDLQQLKEVLFPAVAELRSCLQMAHYMLENLSGQRGYPQRPEIRLPVQRRGGERPRVARHPVPGSLQKSWAGHRERNFQGSSHRTSYTRRQHRKPLYPADRRADGRSTCPVPFRTRRSGRSGTGPTLTPAIGDSASYPRPGKRLHRQ